MDVKYDRHESSAGLLAKLKAPSQGLQFMSEAEYPFEVFVWEKQADECLATEKVAQITGHPAGHQKGCGVRLNRLEPKPGKQARLMKKLLPSFKQYRVVMKAPVQS